MNQLDRSSLRALARPLDMPDHNRCDTYGCDEEGDCFSDCPACWILTARAALPALLDRVDELEAQQLAAGAVAMFREATDQSERVKELEGVLMALEGELSLFEPSAKLNQRMLAVIGAALGRGEDR